VYTAVDGVDCLERVREIAPHVITLDIMMPQIDGWDVATRLRDDPATSDIKVIVLTARAQEADVRRGARVGVDYYLTKPFDPDELIGVVRRLAAGQPV
jgi:CheY-like chemotaxis protein